jgi:hypothetical protein
MDAAVHEATPAVFRKFRRSIVIPSSESRFAPERDAL